MPAFYGYYVTCVECALLSPPPEKIKNILKNFMDLGAFNQTRDGLNGVAQRVRVKIGTSINKITALVKHEPCIRINRNLMAVRTQMTIIMKETEKSLK